MLTICILQVISFEKFEYGYGLDLIFLEIYTHAVVPKYYLKMKAVLRLSKNERNFRRKNSLCQRLIVTSWLGSQYMAMIYDGRSMQELSVLTMSTMAGETFLLLISISLLVTFRFLTNKF